MIRCILSALGLALLTVIGTVTYYEGISLPLFGQVITGEIADRLEGYVAQSEKVAADARAAEWQRQAEAAQTANVEFQKRLTAAKAVEATARVKLEEGIAAYEKRLVDTRRACLLDDDDLSEILRHR